jgi:tripartite-type tricarboxylate transporter receptor subunit TctC
MMAAWLVPAARVLRGACLGLALTASLASPSTAAQQAGEYPSRPIRMLVPYPPGGPTDVVARTLGQRLHESLGQQVVIDNRSGASGAIATETVARASPDGYTLLFGTAGQLVTLPLLAPKISYDPSRDFAAITKIVESPQVLFAHAKFSPNSLSELVAYAKQRPGAINYASVSVGGTGHLGMELLKQATGIDLLHVPYKGAAPATTDLISGQVQIMFSSLPSFLQHVKAGRVKILATGARKRTAAIPDVPAINETIPGYDLLTWYALFAPRRTPPDILRRLHAEVGRIISGPEMGKVFAAQGIDPAPSSAKELEDTIRDETERWRKVIQKAGIRFE